jgi:hypothetical protein
VATSDSIAAAEADVTRLAASMVEMLDPVIAPAALSVGSVVEQLSFLQLRENYRSFFEFFAATKDVPAAHMARALFEESARWSWVDEDVANRKQAFLNESSRARSLIQEAADEQGVDASAFFGEMVGRVVPPYDKNAIRFPNFEGLFEWTPDLRKMMYLQYRLLSQYTHSAVLSAASTAEVVDHQLVNAERLPTAARLLVVRNACASVGFVFDFCKSGLDWPGRKLGRQLNFEVVGVAAEIAEIVYPLSPGTA